MIKQSATFIRDLTREECGWLPQDFKKGDVVFLYQGPTYGAIAFGTAMSLKAGEGPFFEVPDDAIRISQVEVAETELEDYRKRIKDRLDVIEQLIKDMFSEVEAFLNGLAIKSIQPTAVEWSAIRSKAKKLHAMVDLTLEGLEKYRWYECPVCKDTKYVPEILRGNGTGPVHKTVACPACSADKES